MVISLFQLTSLRQDNLKTEFLEHNNLYIHILGLGKVLISTLSRDIGRHAFNSFIVSVVAKYSFIVSNTWPASQCRFPYYHSNNTAKILPLESNRSIPTPTTAMLTTPGDVMQESKMSTLSAFFWFVQFLRNKKCLKHHTLSEVIWDHTVKVIRCSALMPSSSFFESGPVYWQFQGFEDKNG